MQVIYPAPGIGDMTHWIQRILAITLLLLLSACSGGSGSDTVANADFSSSPTAVNYTGPPPANADVQSFKIELWDKLVPENRCGSCHGSRWSSASFRAL